MPKLRNPAILPIAVILLLLLASCSSNQGGGVIPEPEFTLSVEKTGNGSGTVTSDPVGIDCGLNCSETFDEGTLVTLTATPDDDSVFAGWSGCDTTSDTTCTVTLGSSTEVTASFEQEQANTVEVTTEDNVPVASGTLEAGESITFTATTSSSTANAGDLTYFEVTTQEDTSPIEIQVFNPDGSPYAFSTSPEFFAPLTTTVTAASFLTPSAIVVEKSCRGPCVLQATEVGTVEVVLRNDTNSALVYELYAYVDNYGDAGEPVNDDRTGATSLGASETGALETVNDEDFFEVMQGGTLTLSTQTGVAIALRAEIIGSTGSVDTIGPDESFPVLTGDIIRVYSDSGRAGPSSTSTYTLTVQ